MAVSIEEKILLFINSHPELRGKTQAEVISIMCSEGEISDIEAQEALETTVFCENDNSQGNIDSVLIRNKSNNNLKNDNEISSNENTTLSEIFTERMNNTSTSLQAAEESNGFIGKAWSGIKNFFGFGASSNKVREAQETESELISQLDGENASEAFKELTGLDYTDENIEKFKTGEVKLKSEEALEGYKEGQDMAADITGDIVSGIAAFSLYSLSIALTPLTGGASIAIGFAAAGAAGAVVKSGVKALDALSGGREYDSFTRDMVTGAFSGILAPFTGGVGGAVGKSAAKIMGLQTAKQIGKEAVETSAKTGLKQSLKSILTNPTGYKYLGGTSLKRAAAYGTEMAADGALAGGVDNAFRTAYDGGDTEDILNAAAQGTVGGLILSPIIGGAIKYTGSKIGHAENRVRTNYEKAKTASKNVPTVENPDAELAKHIGAVIKEAEELVSSVKVKGNDIIDINESRILTMSNEISSVLQDASIINTELQAIYKENSEIIEQILEATAKGEDPSSLIAVLSNKGISVTDILDKRIRDLSDTLENCITKVQKTVDSAEPVIKEGAELARETIGTGTHIASEAIDDIRKIPETEAFSILGNLPERAGKSYKTLRQEAVKLDEAAKRARQKIKEGNVDEGLAELQSYYNSLDEFNKKLETEITEMSSSAARAGLEDSARILSERLEKLINSDMFQTMSKEQKIEALTENSNILFAKFAQTFSSDKSLPSELTALLKQFTSNCAVSRDINQAQILADEMYGAGKYELIKSFGAGTIGETYLAKTSDGTEVVIKMLKDGVTPEKFAQDRAMFTKYIDEFVENPTEKEYKTNLLNSMFDAWDRELNFGLEAQGAKDMADGATRFKVAQTLEVGAKDGKNISLVMEKAKGVQLDKLLRMIQDYNENPSQYLSKYAKEIEEMPILKNPENWKQDVAAVYTKSQNEQSLFVNASGYRTLHADPHAGNIFIDFNAATGKPEIIYIDTGNVIKRTNEETIKDIGLSMNMMFGNSKGVAESMLEGATLPSGADKTEIINKFAQMLDKKLYKANVNLKNTQYTQNVISQIMKDLNIVPSSNNSNLMKAVLQRIETGRAIKSICGFSGNPKLEDIKDLGIALIKSFKTNPKEAWAVLKPIIKWALENKDQAMITFFQMIIKNTQANS